MGLLIAGVVGLLVIAAATAIAPRIGTAPPLLLAIAGVAIGLLPFVPVVSVDPEVIIAGVLPPLLYSAAVSMPAMDFRRDFRAISGLSVALVVVTSVLLGIVFAALVPGLGLPMGIALGAILSPTDAVATSIVKRLGVSPRITALLEGESLLNDASALVLLRSAIAGAAASISLWHVALDFGYAVVVAVAIGLVVGWVLLRVRARVTNPTVNTVLSFTTPFIASLPAEHLGASGLVAAVAAGIVTGRGAVRHLSPQHRLSDSANWHTIELVLEGAVFLIMGLELRSIVADLDASPDGVGTAVTLAALGLAVTVVVRAAYVWPLLGMLGRRKRRAAAIREAITDSPDEVRKRIPRRIVESERFETRVRRKVADLDYYVQEPLGWREGTILVWAGMRGVVTLAAAQTLPATAPHRSLMVFAAFLVAVASLFLQGATLPLVARRLLPARDHSDAAYERAALKRRLRDAAAQELRGDDTLSPELREMAERMRAAWLASAAEGAEEDGADAEGAWSSAEDAPSGPSGPSAPHAPSAPSAPSAPPPVARPDPGRVRDLRLRMIRAQRAALLEARDDGAFSASALNDALQELDAEQISIEVKQLNA